MSLTMTSPSKQESKSMREAQNLHRLLQERMTELGLLQTEWSKTENEMRERSDALTSQLREVQDRFNKDQIAEQNKHLNALNNMVNSHQEQMSELQEQLDEMFGISEAHSEIDDYDAEIESLREQLREAENLAEMSEIQRDDNFDDDSMAEERLEELESQVEEMDQVYQQVLQQRDQDAKRSTQMIEDIIIKYETQEEKNQQEIAAIVAEINDIDNSRDERIASIRKDVEDSKRQNANQLRNLMARMANTDRELARIRAEHAKRMAELQEEAELARNTLEGLTARKKQQAHETTTNARKYGNEKNSYLTKHKQLQILQTELIREKVEHQTLMKDLSKMDDTLLSGMHTNIGSFSMSKL